MAKLCGKSIAFLLRLIFSSTLSAEIFPKDWKKSTFVPCHERESKNLMKNYQSISLFLISSVTGLVS